VDYPAEWFVWAPTNPDLDCAYFDPASMEGLTADEAFSQAALTVEVLEGAAADEALAFFTENAVAQEEAQVAGLAATAYQSAQGDWGFRAFVAPLGTDPGGPTLVVARWGEVDESLIQMADRVAGSLVLTG
jgi:hypothetical protein